MIIPHSEKAEHIIWELKYEMNNPRTDGYTGSSMKKRLWSIKMAVDKALVDAPEYVGDPDYQAEWLVERLKGNV